MRQPKPAANTMSDKAQDGKLGSGKPAEQLGQPATEVFGGIDKAQRNLLSLVGEPVFR